ncbi:hypothetical protein EJD97_016390 [Solanum chilense]|uniref:Uncharacterized protein n=1 Tax=Solanum chilense TaxID=4083 RepID=A0A6N2BA04_SOLCI|nr:hypothetical protein EJD97_016390 [Solanum chilense]
MSLMESGKMLYKVERFNHVAPGNAPGEESAPRGCSGCRGRGKDVDRGRVREVPTGIEVPINNAPINEIMRVHNEEIEEDTEVGDVEENIKEDELPIQTVVFLHRTGVSSTVMEFFKRFDGPGGLPPTQVQANFPFAKPAPKKGGNRGLDTFFCALFGPDMTGNEHDMLTMFLKIKILIFMGPETEDFYEFILLFTNMG